MIISETISNYLKSNRYDFEVLQSNEWKKTVVLRLIKDGESFILKAVSKESPNKIRSSFEKEKLFYEQYKSDLIPKLIYSSEEMFIVSYCGNRTLRDWLLENEITPEFTSKFVDFIFRCDDFYSEKSSVGKPVFSNAFANLASLCVSGPIQTKEMHVSRIRMLSQSLFGLYLKLRLHLILNKKTFESNPGVSHGDFHYNNILVDERLNFKMIDFERVNKNSYFEFDLLYLLAILEKSTKEIILKKDLKNIQNVIFRRDPIWVKVHSLYKKAITHNNRF